LAGTEPGICAVTPFIHIMVLSGHYLMAQKCATNSLADRISSAFHPIDPSTLRFFHPSPFQKKSFATAKAERLSVP
jgi:hypothetical protein